MRVDIAAYCHRPISLLRLSRPTTRVPSYCRPFATMATEEKGGVAVPVPLERKKKLHGRAFYESIGSPKYIVAPMVDQSEFAWRMLTRSFMSEAEQSKLLAYTPMLHARLFSQEERYRVKSLQARRPGSDEPWLDGNPSIDRPLFVQFCANDPEHLLSAALHAAPHCDAVDLNLGCPQGIARKGHYGAFLQEDQDLVFRLINTLHKGLDVPVTAKIRILEDKEQTLAYAKNVLEAGASILTVHGRRREQKGHYTGVADWTILKFLRESLPPETVLFANGNILQGDDIEKCLAATGFDGVMSAEGNLSDPAVFAKPPPVGSESREYWRSKDGKGGWRLDAVTRRYMDILHKYALGQEPPTRRPLFMPGDDTAWMEESEDAEDGRPSKKRKTEGPTKGPTKVDSPNMSAIQSHLFSLLRHFVARHTDIRDMLARAGKQPRLDGYEAVLTAMEKRIAQGLIEYTKTDGKSWDDEVRDLMSTEESEKNSVGAAKRCKRPWWVAQPHIRPLPEEAFAKGAVQLSKKELKARGLDDGKSGKMKKVAEEVPGEIKERDILVAG